jgi:hypothetical protein
MIPAPDAASAFNIYAVHWRYEVDWVWVWAKQ